MVKNLHGQPTIDYSFYSLRLLSSQIKKQGMRFFINLCLIFLMGCPTYLTAQEESLSCPCENCPGLIEDELEFREYQLNIFNITNGTLLDPNQCVSKVGVKFKHEYVGDLLMELVSPDGIVVKLIGQVTTSRGEQGQTDNRVFDISFVPNSVPAQPDMGFEPQWENDQNWTGIGILNGSYHVNRGDLADFNRGRVNGTWTLRVADFGQENNDEGELLDFYIEFCDSEGLVCDPCLDPEDTPDCVFGIDAGELTVVPDEEFCLPIYAENVAFLDRMQFPLNWDPTVLQFIKVDSFKSEFLKPDQFDLREAGSGNLTLNYRHTFDNLGLVVKDSTAIFSVCFKAIGGVGDSTLITVPSGPTAINVDNENLLTTSMEGTVKIAVDSTADCVRAIQLCGNQAISIDKSRGPGFAENEACTPDGQEFQVKWFRWDVLESGTLDFMIKPKGNASYGYSLYKGSCPNESGEIAGCESGFPILEGRIIGVADNPQASFGVLDDAMTNFAPSITAISGETYFLLVDNFSNNGIGFDLSFAGDAKIGDETIQATIADPQILNCTNPTIQLDATASSQGAQYTPVWSTDTGSINTTVGIFEPLVIKGGKFVLTISDEVSGCVVKDSVNVLTDKIDPIAIANNGGTLNCARPTLDLNTIGSSSGDEFNIEWNNLSNSTLELPITSTLMVEEGGAYELTLTNSINGCFAKDTVDVLEDFVNPPLTAPDNFISCEQPIATLSAESTAEVGFEWTGGNLDGLVGSPQILVTEPGIFVIKITALNGCTNSDTVIVRDEKIFPKAEAGDPIILNCENPVKALNGNDSDKGAGITFAWTTVNGQFADSANINGLEPLVNKEGIYELAVTNTVNGCTTKDTVSVDTNFINPTILLASDTVLSCAEPTIVIDATQSDSGAIFEFDWFAGEGNPIENSGTYQPSVTQAGDYIFNLKNTENGCVSSELLNILADVNLPTADAGQANTLTCLERVATLDGTNSSQGNSFLYEWTTENGNILGTTDNLTTEVDSAGIYTLTVMDATNGCVATANVEISKSFENPQLTIPDDALLTCQNPSLSLLATSETENTSFVWQLPDATEIAEDSINTNLAGNFTVTATAPNGCFTVDSLQLIAEQVLPTIQVEPPSTITCTEETIIIDGLNSDQGDNFNINWTTEDGAFIDDQQSKKYNPEVNKGGTYTVEILNTETGCIATENILVPESTNRPTINLNEPELFSCANTRVPLIVTTNAANVTFQWKLESETLATRDTFEADKPGIYSIIVLNVDNNCSSLSSIEVQTDTIKPLAEAGENLELNCAEGEVELDGNQSIMGEEFQYLWTTQTNQNLSEDLKVVVTEVGLYNLIVVDQSNGCRSIDTVRVTESRDNPIADAGKDTIYCNGAEELDFTLGGNTTSEGSNFSYQWTNIDGTILGDSITQQVGITDTFVLRVVNTDNNCTSVDSVIVFEKPRPEISLTESGGINCGQNEITYLAESDLPNTSIKWVGENDIPGAELVVTDVFLGESFVAFAEDTITGCKGTSSIIIVSEDRQLPIISAGEDTEVNCVDTLRLDGQILSQNILANIEWTTLDGNIVTAKDSLNPVVDVAGTYVLTIENTSNFCINKDTVLVETNQIIPTISLAEQAILTCNEPELTIRPDEISTGADFHSFWKKGKDIISLADSLIVDLPNTYELLVIDSSNLCTNSAFIEIKDSLNPPSITIELPDTINCLNNQVIINTNIDVENGSYEWSILEGRGHILGSKNSPDLLVDSAGTYEIQVTNEVTGCVGNRNIQVIDIRENLDIEAGSNQTITCFNDTTVLAAGTIFSQSDHLVFTWTADVIDFQPIDTTLIFTIAEPGTYYLDVRDTISACTTRDSFTVTRNIEDLDFSVGAVPTLDCATETVIIGDINDLGVEGYNYQWSTENGRIRSGENQPAVLVEQAGLYQIDIENNLNGCTFSDTVQVEENKVFPTIDLGEPGQKLTCMEEEITIGSGNSSQGTTFSYEWSVFTGNLIPNENTPFLTVQDSGVYELTITDTSNNCSVSDTIRVVADRDFPRVTFPNEVSFLCSDASKLVIPTIPEKEDDLLFSWQTNDGIILSETDDLNLEVGTTGWYILALENTKNSCQTIDSIFVADDRVLPTVANLEDRMLGCVVTDLTISAQGSEIGDNIFYAWKNLAGETLSNNTTLTLNEPGTYFLQVTNETNNCVNTDTFLVTENNNPPTSADFIIASPTCEGENDGFIEVNEVTGGTPPYQYQLDVADPTFTQLFPDLAPDTYTLTIIDEAFCEWDTLIQLNQPDSVRVDILPAVDNLVTGELGFFSVATSLNPTEIAEIIWSPATLFDCNNCTEVSTSFASSTTIGVTIIDVNGCESSNTLNVEVDLATVPNAITPNGDGANDVFMVPQIEAAPDAFPDSELVIFNRWGDVLYRASPYQNDWAGTNNQGTQLLEGTYYYVLRLDTREGEFIKGDITILRR